MLVLATTSLIALKFVAFIFFGRALAVPFSSGFHSVTDAERNNGGAILVNPPHHSENEIRAITDHSINPTSSLAICDGTSSTTGAEALPSSTSEVLPTQTFHPTLPFPLVITVRPPASSSDSAQTRVSTITQPASTVTIQLPPATITSYITVTNIPITPTPTTIIATATPMEWFMPAQFTSLDDAFEISHFAYGRENLRLVTVKPAASSDISDSYSDGMGDEGGYATPTGQNKTILQMFYPARSYSPSHQPRGGADFYSSPSLPSSTSQQNDTLKNSGTEDSLNNGRIDWKRANNVTLTYAVYFPADFDFVRGGKLPGLFGGHRKCSGGDDGLGCFSTRLMWRSGGKGELYLYAPKDRQPTSLCSTPPLSVCDPTFGLSIGRGSFTFPRGEWYWVRQTVWLNTPGKADGGFILEVGNDGENMNVVLNSAEVFYRDIGGANDDNVNGQMIVDDIYGEDEELSYPTIQLKATPWAAGLLTNANQQSHLVEGSASNSPPLLHHMEALYTSTMEMTPIATEVAATVTAAAAYAYAVEGTKTVTMPNYHTNTVLIPVVTQTKPVTPLASSVMEFSPGARGFDSPGPEPSIIARQEDSDGPDPIGFLGIFFSTFFGGSTSNWASPRDQRAWFSDFMVRVNA